jgi:hypothetical protein
MPAFSAPGPCHTLGCDNFGAVNSIPENREEPAVLEHSKRWIKPFDKMRAWLHAGFIIARLSSSREASIASLSIHGSLSASG